MTTIHRALEQLHIAEDTLQEAINQLYEASDAPDTTHLALCNMIQDRLTLLRDTSAHLKRYHRQPPF